MLGKPQIWPVRTVTAMRRVLGAVLRSGAGLFLVIDNGKQHDQFQREMDGVRDRVGKNISALRTMREAVEYEFGVDREQHVRTSEIILRSSLTAAALIWNQVAVLHGKQESDFLTEPGLAEMRQRLADRLSILAEAVSERYLCPRNIWNPWSAGIYWKTSNKVKRKLRWQPRSISCFSL